MSQELPRQWFHTKFAERFAQEEKSVILKTLLLLLLGTKINAVFSHFQNAFKIISFLKIALTLPVSFY